MAKRKPISKKIRFEVFKRDSFICQYCGRSAPEVVLHVDHIQPVSKDGDNDLFNLATSCEDCNAGKSDRLLSDNSVLQRQKAQLDDLQERRDQLDMLLEWRRGLKSITDDTAEAAVRACDDLTPGWAVNESGKQDLRRLIKKFGINTVLGAIDESKVYLKYNNKDVLTKDSVNEAFDKLGGICRLSQQPDWKRELYYIRGILRKRFTYCNDWQAIQFMENAYNDGVPPEELREIACTTRNWTQWVATLTDARERWQNSDQ